MWRVVRHEFCNGRNQPLNQNSLQGCSGGNFSNETPLGSTEKEDGKLDFHPVHAFDAVISHTRQITFEGPIFVLGDCMVSTGKSRVLCFPDVRCTEVTRACAWMTKGIVIHQ